VETFEQGKVVTVTAGTPVALSAPPSNRFQLVCAILIAQVPGTTGNVYFGKKTMTKSTYVGVVRPFLPPGASGFIDSEVIGDMDGPNVLDPTQYGVDSDTNGMGLVITYFQA
jgi:hypothetical protein